MSAMSDLAYDIEQLYIEGLSARYIARELNCPIETVLAWIESQSVADQPQEEYDPFNTVNS
jgi:DNA-directed RNA polymerase specialized sigma24 family protein